MPPNTDAAPWLLWAGVTAVAALFALWLLMFAVNRLCRRAGLGGGVSALVTLATPVVLLVGASLYLDWAGIESIATVDTKEESVRFSAGPATPGSWNRTLRVTATLPVDAGSLTTLVFLDEAGFDAVRPGGPVRVRYVPTLPFVARAANRSTLALVPWRWLIWAALLVGTVAVVLRLTWVATSSWPVRAAVAGLLAIALPLTSLPSPWDPDPPGPRLTGTGEVRDVRTVRRTPAPFERYESAPQPWHQVAIAFVPEGTDQPVVAVDGVDEGSVPDLVVGARVSISYPPGSPRAARLAVGTRTYRWRQWRHALEICALLAGILLGGLALERIAGRLWRRGKPSGTS